MSSRLAPQRGFSLMEILVAMSIFAIASALMGPSFTYHLKKNRDSEVRNGAMGAAQQVLDELRLESPSTLPSSGSSTSTVSGGERSYSVTTSYCTVPSQCSTSSRQIKVAVAYKNNEVFSVETIFSQLR